MTEREPNFSRSERKKRRNRSGNILNILIGVVVLLIIIVGATIFLGNGSNEKADDNELITTEGADNQSKDTEEDSQVIDEEIADEDVDSLTEENNSDSSGSEESEESEGSTTNQETDKVEENSEDDSESSGSVTSVTSDDDIIAETVVDTAWRPIGTIQSGEHVSQYDLESVDWDEKKQALAYATGLSQDSMIFWRIKNGGGPQKSVGIVSSKDKSEKYRVYLEWVDGQGWKPVKMDVLKTLDFEY
jgi:Domain of unknown function (DUF1510)